ncbi:MAG: hypothetical protein C0480_00625 [Bradyrhizobium sp.]|nr:hypothetical protein [Bradyrhizobium sp.]
MPNVRAKVLGVRRGAEALVCPIKADGRILRVAMKKQPTLDFIQQAVGGSIEMVPHFIKYEGRPVTVVYANEEARRMTLKFNTLGTQAWLLCLHGGLKGYRPQLFGDILIVMRTLNA